MKKHVSRVLAACLSTLFTIVVAGGTVWAASKATPALKVDLNAASVQQLTELPGVGEKLAQRIVAYRQKSGGFKSRQELLNVKGIGEKNFQKLEPHVTVGDSTSGKSAPK